MGRSRKDAKVQSTIQTEIFEVPQEGVMLFLLGRELIGGQDVITVDISSVIAGMKSKGTSVVIPYKYINEFCDKLKEYAKISPVPTPPAAPSLDQAAVIEIEQDMLDADFKAREKELKSEQEAA